MPSFLRTASGSGAAIDFGNVIAGEGCRDRCSDERARVTAVLFGANLTPVSAGGIDIAGNFGVLHMDPCGRYAYARGKSGPMPAAPCGDVDRFTFQIVDRSGTASVGVLDFPANPATAPARSAATTAFAGLDARRPDPARNRAMAVDEPASPGDPLQRVLLTIL